MIDEDDDKDCAICSDLLEEREWVVLYACKHAAHADCLEKWFVNQCTWLYKSRKKNDPDHEDVNKRLIGRMECLDVAPKCPLCRTLWVPDARTIEPPMKHLPNQTTNEILKLTVVRLLEALDKKRVPKIMVDEATDKCPLCDKLLATYPWSRLKPCTHPFHISCIVKVLRNAYWNMHENEAPILDCPCCDAKIKIVKPSKWVPAECTIRPVVPQEYLGDPPMHVGSGSLEAHPSCIFANLWGKFVDRRDGEFYNFLVARFASEEDVESDRERIVIEEENALEDGGPGLGFKEFQCICYICKGVLARNWWVEVECGHCFHLRCIVPRTEKGSAGRECPICLLALSFSKARMPVGVLWYTLDIKITDFPFVKTQGRQQLHEAVLWWTFDQELCTLAQEEEEGWDQAC